MSTSIRSGLYLSNDTHSNFISSTLFVFFFLLLIMCWMCVVIDCVNDLVTTPVMSIRWMYLTVSVSFPVASRACFLLWIGLRIEIESNEINSSILHSQVPSTRKIYIHLSNENHHLFKSFFFLFLSVANRNGPKSVMRMWDIT